MRRILAGAAALATSQAAVAALGLVQSVVLARFMGPAMLGEWAVIVGLATVVRAVAGFRTSEALTRELVRFRSAGDLEGVHAILAAALVADLVASGLGVLIVLGAAPWAAAHIAGGERALSAYWIYAAVLLFGFCESTWLSVCRDQRRFPALATLPAAIALLRTLGVAAYAASGELTLQRLAAWYLAAEVVQCAIMLVMLRFFGRLAYGATLRDAVAAMARRRGDLKEFWRFMTNTYVSSIFSALAKGADVLILGYFRSETEVGVYRIARTLVAAAQNLLQTVGTVAYQDFNEVIARGDFARVRNVVHRLLPGWSVGVGVAVLVASMLSPMLVTFVFGNAYRDAATIFNLLLIAASISFMVFWAQPCLLALGEHAFYAKWVTAVCLVVLIVMFPMTYLFGASGMAVTIGALFSLLLGGMAVRSEISLRRAVTRT